MSTAIGADKIVSFLSLHEIDVTFKEHVIYNVVTAVCSTNRDKINYVKLQKLSK